MFFFLKSQKTTKIKNKFKPKTKQNKESFGRIVTIVSQSSVDGMPYEFAYGAAKGGLIAANRVIAREHAKGILYYFFFFKANNTSMKTIKQKKRWYNIELYSRRYNG